MDSGYLPVRAKLAAFVLQRFVQPAEIHKPVLVIEEIGPRLVLPCASGHAQRLAEIGKLSQGKNGYRLNDIRAKRADTSFAWIELELTSD